MESNNEKNIHLFFNNLLSSEELIIFKNTDDYAEIVFFDEQLKKYKAPSFDTHQKYLKLNSIIKEKKRKKKTRKYLLIAATIIVFFSIGNLLFNHNETHKISTDKIMSFYLPDSSIVFMNQKSKISYNTKNWKKDRSLYLDGEAYFKVKKGSNFSVKTKEGEVNVLGTSFSVKQREKIFSVHCYTGIVKIKSNEIDTVLNQNMSLEIIDKTAKIETITNSKLIKPKWVNPKIYFKNELISKVIKELEFYYNINIKTTDRIADKKYTGYINLERSIEQNLQIICEIYGLKYQKNKNEIELF